MASSSRSTWEITVDGSSDRETSASRQPPLVLGRVDSSPAPFSHPTVEIEHVRIAPRRGAFWLQDLNTEHGTFVNERRVDRHTLKTGDRIHLGECPIQIAVVESGDWLHLSVDGRSLLIARSVNDGALSDGSVDAGAVMAGLAFGDRGEGRQIKWASVAALVFHFALLTMLLPPSAGPDLFDLDSEAVVVRRYQPPKPPQRPPRVVRRRRVLRLPIPDPTPDLPELVMDEEVPQFEQLEEADIDFTDLPLAGQGPPPGAAAVEMTTEGLVPPGLLERVDPEYDRTRARRGIQGKADIEIVIDEAGTVIFSRLINSTTDEELDRLAVEAVRKWLFSAATLDGEPVRVRAVVTINFRIY